MQLNDSTKIYAYVKDTLEKNTKNFFQGIKSTAIQAVIHAIVAFSCKILRQKSNIKKGVRYRKSADSILRLPIFRGAT